MLHPYFKSLVLYEVHGVNPVKISFTKMFFFFSCIVSRLFEAVLTCLALEDKEVNRFRVYYSFLYILKIVPSSVIKRV